MAWYVVDYSGTMEDGPVPVFAGRIIICEVGAGHLGKSAPGSFNKAAGALSFVGGCDDI